MATKLYVGNLAYSVTSSDLEGLFAQFGEVASATVITDQFSGKSKGFGFVEMSDTAAATEAIGQLNDTELKGRNIKVNTAQPKRQGFGGGAGGGDRGGNRGGGSGGRGGNRW